LDELGSLVPIQAGDLDHKIKSAEGEEIPVTLHLIFEARLPESM
jgi:hypothetical protein